MEMLIKNIVAAGCGRRGDASAEMMPSVSDALNDKMIEAVGLARAYVPVQPYSEPRDDMASLSCGTAFGDLVMPYVKGSSLRRNMAEVCDDEQR